MYEHPYFAEKVAEFETERLQRAADRRRFLAEHADQIVPRAPGAVRRLGARMLRAITRPQTNAADAAPDAVAVAPITTITASGAARAAVRAEPAPAAPPESLAAFCCEPAPAR